MKPPFCGHCTKLQEFCECPEEPMEIEEESEDEPIETNIMLQKIMSTSYDLIYKQDRIIENMRGLLRNIQEIWEHGQSHGGTWDALNDILTSENFRSLVTKEDK